MVKKVEIHARVLRPGESIALSCKFSEFEIVLFRPRHHDRTKLAKASALKAEVTDISPVGDSSQDFINHASGANIATSKSTIPTSSTGNDAGPAEKKSATGYSILRPSALGLRDASGIVDVDDPSGAPFAPRAVEGGNEVKALTDIGADAPLFFDTAVCIFYDGVSKMDYVSTGRTTTDSKGLYYKPHLVVLGTEPAPGGYCNFNITGPKGEPLGDGQDDAFDEDCGVFVNRAATSNGPVAMAAADGVEVNLRRLDTCAGFLVSATLFSQDRCLSRERNVFYMVRRARSSTPLCLVPLCIYSTLSSSCVSLMVRKVRVHGETTWELVNVSEPLLCKDVKGLILKLQERGLADPAHFARDYEVKAVANRGGDGSSVGTEEDVASGSGQSSSSELHASASHKRLSYTFEQEQSLTSMRASLTGERHCPPPHNRSSRTFSTLLSDVPRVVREGRRQYNVGRSHVQTNLFDGDTSEEDEVLDDAMRAVVPRYADASLVRYEHGAYNIGSRVGNLVTHYVSHRETYGFDAASQRLARGGRLGGSRDELLPSLGAPRARSSGDLVTLLPALDRCQPDDSEFAARPELPADLLLTSLDRQLAARAQQHSSSINANMKKRRSTVGRARHSSSLRRSRRRKGSKRSPSARASGRSRSHAKKKGGGKKTKGTRGSESASGIPGHRSVSASPQRSSSSSSAHKLKARKMQSRVSSGKS
ncbi:conserved hypothetical protein [Leishmania mexicana MHOM/GT/2001/U1103]|uniref:Uncharacterized protein n=1 Tax=Leishmania mexicana (strain MHOM/GT/2001/U1103) TaxID=929439 RepID=E9AYF1_LEIMU|nr:conserved hypothetical protein [Leishmania mexicana MHOM/GT/2001/U1103]CBZ27992.1 conserved hypothetical protein [Leishmania mexicana MHOM/GT/2001/U1103]